MTTLTIPSAAVQICWDAADIIEAHGWDPTTEICEETDKVGLIGALRWAARPDYPRWAMPWVSNIPAYDDALRLLDRKLGGQSAREWSKGKSMAQVVALLRGVG